MKLRFAQFGISHDHAPSKARTLKASEDVDFVGIYEPSAEARETLGANDAFDGVHWLSSAEEVLEDETIVGVAAQGRVSENLDFARAAVEHGKHVWFDKPAGDDLEAFRAVLDIAREKRLCVQLGYMFRYNAGFQFCARLGKLRETWATYFPFADASRRAVPMNPCGRGGIHAANTKGVSCSFLRLILSTSLLRY